MKYDKPVWQLMHACADAMPDTFRYEDVRDWFQSSFPDVNEATIRAHLIGLTEGGRTKHVQFAQRSPVFRRVARGEYASIPLAERGEDPHAEMPSASKLKMSQSVRPTRSAPGAAEIGERKAGAVEDTAEASAPSTAGPTSEANPKLATPKPKKPKRKSPKPKKPKHAEAGPDAEAEESKGPTAEADIVLLGSIGDRVNVPAPAKEVFREVSFQLSRIEAEVSGSEWFVLSAEHGLVAPNEWISPDSRTLADMEPSYRVTWASWVVARLESLVGSLDGQLVRVDAPDEFIGPLFADLQDAGAIVLSGTVALTVPPVSSPVEPDPVVAGRMVETDASTMRPAEVAKVLTIDLDSPISMHLADQHHAVPATDLSGLPECPGLYGWLVDSVGARELNRSLMLPVRTGLIFVGQVGGSSWQSLADPVLNLRDHVERIQLHGRSRASTFRMTLATVLRDHLQMTSLEDPRLTEWMLEHLSVSSWTSDNLGELRELEQLVVSELDPPLNVDHLPASEYRARLSQMRSALG